MNIHIGSPRRGGKGRSLLGGTSANDNTRNDLVRMAAHTKPVVINKGLRPATKADLASRADNGSQLYLMHWFDGDGRYLTTEVVTAA